MAAAQRLVYRTLIVGDQYCGKTTLWRALTGSQAEESTAVNVDVTLGDGQVVTLCLEETLSGAENRPERLETYADARAVILCFKVSYGDTLINIAEDWYPEIRRTNATVPLFLVGLKMRADDVVVVQQIDADQVTRTIRAVNYFECTSANVQTARQQILKSIAGTMMNPMLRTLLHHAQR